MFESQGNNSPSALNAGQPYQHVSLSRALRGAQSEVAGSPAKITAIYIGPQAWDWPHHSQEKPSGPEALCRQYPYPRQPRKVTCTPRRVFLGTSLSRVPTHRLPGSCVLLGHDRLTSTTHHHHTRSNTPTRVDTPHITHTLSNLPTANGRRTLPPTSSFASLLSHPHTTTPQAKSSPTAPNRAK